MDKKARDSAVPVAASSICIAKAAPDDAPWISSLYRKAYSREDAEDAEEHYPFPQFMDSDWLEEAVTNDEMVWFVARNRSEVIGTVGAVANVAASGDCVAELFGLVVNEDYHGHGVATQLFSGLHDALAKTASFMIAETRTANAGGWRTAKKFGFFPIGFEPFAHRTPVGAEPMLLLGWVSSDAMLRRVGPSRWSSSVERIAASVLHILPQRPAVRSTPFPVGAEFDTVSGGIFAPSADEMGNIDLQLEIRPIKGDTTIPTGRNVDWTESGVVSTARIEGRGLNDSRYVRRRIVATLNERHVATVRFILDRSDRRARISELRVEDSRHIPEILHRIITLLQTISETESLTLVLDVLADAQSLHEVLEKLGFFPTAYYPAFVQHENCRRDAVQFTKLWRYEFKDSLDWVRDLEWDEAMTAVETVTKLADSTIPIET